MPWAEAVVLSPGRFGPTPGVRAIFRGGPPGGLTPDTMWVWVFARVKGRESQGARSI